MKKTIRGSMGRFTVYSGEKQRFDWLLSEEACEVALDWDSGLELYKKEDNYILVHYQEILLMTKDLKDVEEYLLEVARHDEE